MLKYDTLLAIGGAKTSSYLGNAGSITTIGVFNQLSVIGDSNTLTTDQTGDNSGAVTSTTDPTYDTTYVTPKPTLFTQP